MIKNMQLENTIIHFKHIFEDFFKGPTDSDVVKRREDVNKDAGIDIVLNTDAGQPITIMHTSETELISWYELSDDEKKDFDYYCENGDDAGMFFRYSGDIYDMSDFTRLEEGGVLAVAGWQGRSGQGWWSAILVAVNDSGDGVKVAKASW